MPNSIKPVLSRREFIAQTIATGFALAVQPVQASAKLTENSGISEKLVTIATGNGNLPSYIAHPAGDGRWPLILVIQEIFGVHAHIQDVCRRLAKLGYLAIAPELFFRHGDASKIKDINEILSTIVTKVPDQQVLTDLDAAVAWAENEKLALKDQLGITGFCWGGRITWLYAAHQSKVKAAVAWYGRLEGKSSDLQPLHPADIASQITTPVLGLYGGADQGIPLESVERMREGLAKGQSISEIIVYPDTPHAFFADYRASYRKTEAEDGWNKLQAWFTKHGLPPVGV